MNGKQGGLGLSILENEINLKGVTAPNHLLSSLTSSNTPERVLAGTTCVSCLPVSPDEIFDIINTVCDGRTGSFCDLWNDPLGRTLIQDGIITEYCSISQTVCNPPFSCLTDFITGSTGGICGGDLNPELRDCAVNAFFQQSELPGFPSTFVTDTVSNAVLGFSSRSIAYTYLPLFIIVFLVIWIMVGVGWIGIGAGILFTVATLVILYFFFVSYRASFEVYVDNNITNIDSEVTLYKNQVNKAIPKIPGALASALCVYTGNCFGCTGGLPSCSGCTGLTGGAPETFGSNGCSGCKNKGKSPCSGSGPCTESIPLYDE